LRNSTALSPLTVPAASRSRGSQSKTAEVRVFLARTALPSACATRLFKITVPQA
jgi:hypothetical protein